MRVGLTETRRPDRRRLVRRTVDIGARRERRPEVKARAILPRELPKKRRVEEIEIMLSGRTTLSWVSGRDSGAVIFPTRSFINGRQRFHFTGPDGVDFFARTPPYIRRRSRAY